MENDDVRSDLSIYDLWFLPDWFWWRHSTAQANSKKVKRDQRSKISFLLQISIKDRSFNSNSLCLRPTLDKGSYSQVWIRSRSRRRGKEGKGLGIVPVTLIHSCSPSTYQCRRRPLLSLDWKWQRELLRDQEIRVWVTVDDWQSTVTPRFSRFSHRVCQQEQRDPDRTIMWVLYDTVLGTVVDRLIGWWLLYSDCDPSNAE